MRLVQPILVQRARRFLVTSRVAWGTKMDYADSVYDPAQCAYSREVAVGMTGQYKSLKSTNLVLLIKNIKKVSNMEHIGMKLIVGVQK